MRASKWPHLFFKRIAEQVLPYLDVPRDVPIGPRLVQAAYKNRQVSDRATLEDSLRRIFLGSRTGLQQKTGAKSKAAMSQTPSVTMAVDEGGDIQVPDFSGKTMRDVTEIACDWGWKPVLIAAVCYKFRRQRRSEGQARSKDYVQFGHQHQKLPSLSREQGTRMRMGLSQEERYRTPPRTRSTATKALCPGQSRGQSKKADCGIRGLGGHSASGREQHGNSPGGLRFAEGAARSAVFRFTWGKGGRKRVHSRRYKEGAVAVPAKNRCRHNSPPGVAWIQVREARKGAGDYGCELPGHPASALQLVAVTGTNGKTTTTSVVECHREGFWRGRPDCSAQLRITRRSATIPRQTPRRNRWTCRDFCGDSRRGRKVRRSGGEFAFAGDGPLVGMPFSSRGLHQPDARAHGFSQDV